MEPLVVSFVRSSIAIRTAWAVESGRNNRSMTIGWHGYRLKIANTFKDNGYENEAAFRDSIGINKRTWGKYVRIAGLFPDLSEEEFTSMTAENAELLGTLPVECRNHVDWLLLARTLKAEDFRRKIILHSANTLGVEPAEMRVSYKVSVFESQRKVIKEGVAEFTKENGIVDEGTGLEWAIMEVTGRQSFAGFLRKQLPILRAALRDGEDLKSALSLHIVAMHDLLQSFKMEKA